MSNGQTELPSAVDVLIVGAGFSGMYLLHRLRGIGLSARVIESGSGVGGTWFWNRYPGARVDIRSLEYSFSFSEELENEWKWSERYAPQAELLAYAEHVADRFNLRDDIQFKTRVVSAHYDDTDSLWNVRTDSAEHFRARYVMMATGCLSVPTEVDFAGIDSFAGKIYRTSRWPHEGVDFTGQSVGIIGTGSSAIQSIPVIAEQAAHLHVFQRTANYALPAHNGPLAAEFVADWHQNRAQNRAASQATQGGFLNDYNEGLTFDVSDAEREREYQARWDAGGFAILSSFADFGIDAAANAEAGKFVARKIRAQVKDPKVADLLVPHDHPIGTKRLCVDSGYYTTFNRDNVTLIDIRTHPIQAITPSGLRTSNAEYSFDNLILATGFDAMTGALDRIDIRGRGGVRLRDEWAQGPKTYLGLMVAGFPNMFMITGPGSPSVLTNMLASIEQHVDWIIDCLGYMASHQQSRIEPTPAAQVEWVAHVNETAHMTLAPQANSWYMGANVPGKPRMFMPYVAGLGVYRLHCAEIAAQGYTGFAIGGAH